MGGGAGVNSMQSAPPACAGMAQWCSAAAFKTRHVPFAHWPMQGTPLAFPAAPPRPSRHPPHPPIARCNVQRSTPASTQALFRAALRLAALGEYGHAQSLADRCSRPKVGRPGWSSLGGERWPPLCCNLAPTPLSPPSSLPHFISLARPSHPAPGEGAGRTSRWASATLPPPPPTHTNLQVP